MSSKQPEAINSRTSDMFFFVISERAIRKMHFGYMDYYVLFFALY